MMNGNRIKRLSIVGLVFLCSVFGIQAQKAHHNIKLGFSAGYESYFGATNKPAQVREYESAYDNYYECGLIIDDQSIGAFHAGVQAEYFLCDNRLGISSGLRFSQTSAELKSNENFFFWKIGEENLTTDYLRIKKISEQNYWLGIPVELRFFPNKRELPVQHYFKLCYSYNILIGSHNRVSFQNSGMDKYASDVQEQLAQPSPAYSYLYPACGLKIGRFKDSQQRSPWINVEFHFPGVLIAKHISSFLNPYESSGLGLGLGLQLTIQFPLGTSVPIGHK